jgi:ketosteroid isomerase-like protein
MTRPASSASPREVFERVLRAILDVQMDVYADLFAADGTFELPFAPPGIPRRIEGREAIRAFIRAGAETLRAAPPRWQFRSVVVHQTVDPEVIVTELEVHGVAVQGPYQFSNLQVMTVRKGEIVSLRDYWNPLDRPELAALAKAPLGPQPANRERTP